MKSDLMWQIRQEMSGLSKSQKAIGRFILEHYEKAAYMTAAKLGEYAGVSESTVVRFAIEMGYDGYPALQEALRDLVRTRLTAVQRMEITNDRIGNSHVLDRVLGDDMDRIRMTLESVDRDRFEQAVEMLCAARTVYIAGVRATSSLASFLYFNCNLIFPDVKLIATTSGNEIFEQMLHIGPQDVLIAISFPRYSKHMIDAAQYAASNGAHIVAVTDSLMSPIAEYAQCVLTAKSDMVSFIDSLVAPLSLLNALVVAIARKKQGELATAFEKLEKIWDAYEVYDKENER